MSIRLQLSQINFTTRRHCKQKVPFADKCHALEMRKKIDIKWIRGPGLNIIASHAATKLELRWKLRGFLSLDISQQLISSLI